MEALAKVIGPAPSELTLEELEKILAREHSRVSAGLLSGARPVKRKLKAKSATQVSKAKALEKKYGMSLEEMGRKLALLKKLEEKGGLNG